MLESQEALDESQRDLDRMETLRRAIAKLEEPR
jgi:hypothetical protein